MEQFAEQWKLRMMAQKAALKGKANSKLRRLLARNRPSDCTGAKAVDSALFYKPVDQKSAPRWRGAAAILEIDETGPVGPKGKIVLGGNTKLFSAHMSGLSGRPPQGAILRASGAAPVSSANCEPAPPS